MSARAVAGKELRDIFRERTIVVAILVQFFIAAFSSFLTVGLLAIYDPESTNAKPRASVAYVGDAGDDGFDDVLAAQAPNLRLQHAPDSAAALERFARGGVAMVLEETPRIGGGTYVAVLVAEGDLRATLLVAQVGDLLESYENTLRLQHQAQVRHRIVEVPEPAGRTPIPHTFVYGTLVPLLLLTPVFLSGALAGDSVSGEVQGRTLLILRSAPVTLRRLLAAKLAIPILLAPALFLLWSGLLAANGVAVHNLALLLLLAGSVTAVLCGAGTAIAARLGREGATQAAYAFLAIAMFAVSVVLPRDPLNAIARLASGDLDALGLATVAGIAVAGAASVWAGTSYAARRLSRD